MVTLNIILLATPYFLIFLLFYRAGKVNKEVSKTIYELRLRNMSLKDRIQNFTRLLEACKQGSPGALKQWKEIFGFDLNAIIKTFGGQNG